MKSPQLLSLGIITFFTMCTAVTMVLNPVPAPEEHFADTLYTDPVLATATPFATATPIAGSPTPALARIEEKPVASTPDQAASVENDLDGFTSSQTTKKHLPDRELPDTGDLLELLEPTATPSLVPTPTETVSQLLKSRIVFYLIVPEHGRTDACGNPTLIPIISQRHHTGDKLRDVQIGLQMLFDLGVKYYGPYYNALWDTRMTINSVEYRKKEDYAIIDFGGFLPVMQMSKCDKRARATKFGKPFSIMNSGKKRLQLTEHS